MNGNRRRNYVKRYQNIFQWGTHLGGVVVDCYLNIVVERRTTRVKGGTKGTIMRYHPGFLLTFKHWKENR